MLAYVVSNTIRALFDLAPPVGIIDDLSRLLHETK